MEVSMSKRSLFLAATWAAGTFGLVLAAGLPQTLVAVDQPNVTPLVGRIATAKLMAGAIELSVEVQGRDGPATRPSPNVFASGAPLSLIVHAVNHGLAADRAPFTVRLTSQSLGSSFGRTLPIPQEIWKQSDTAALEIAQSKSMTFTTPAIPADRIVSVDLICGKDAVVAYRFSSNSRAGEIPTTQPIAIVAVPTR
jgi:hypothetical protein